LESSIELMKFTELEFGIWNLLIQKKLRNLESERKSNPEIGLEEVTRILSHESRMKKVTRNLSHESRTKSNPEFQSPITNKKEPGVVNEKLLTSILEIWKWGSSFADPVGMWNQTRVFFQNLKESRTLSCASSSEE
jgi:hypothetical protein